MPRANRCYLEGHIWHITHRCHRRRFLLRFVRDRRAWVGWLYEARARFGLCVLDYTVTSNHVHLLVRDRGLGEIADSMQLIAGRTAQAFNERKERNGAFWEDRYHATAVDIDNVDRLAALHREWVDAALQTRVAVERADYWTESMAVGGASFVKAVQAKLGARASERSMDSVSLSDGLFALREPEIAYSFILDTESESLRQF